MASIEFDHMGVVVHDLEKVARFFDALGFVRQGSAEVGGEWVDRVIGVAGARADMIMVSAPDGSGALEISAFREPVNADPSAPDLSANAHGYRHVAYRVDDIAAIVTKVHAAGYDLVGEIVDYEDIYRLAYIRGPEGIIVEVAERLSGNDEDLSSPPAT